MWLIGFGTFALPGNGSKQKLTVDTHMTRHVQCEHSMKQMLIVQ